MRKWTEDEQRWWKDAFEEAVDDGLPIAEAGARATRAVTDLLLALDPAYLRQR
jgi:hypothetical protein